MGNMSQRMRAAARYEQLAKDAAASDRLIAPQTASDRVLLRRRLRSGQLISPASGLYAPTGQWRALNPRSRTLKLIRSLAALHDSWTFRSHSAALLWGLDVPYPLLMPIRVIAQSRPTRDGSTRTRRLSPRDRIVPVGGIRATSFWTTVYESLTEAPFDLGLAVADSALRLSGMNSCAAWDAMHEEVARRHRLPRVRFILQHADPKSENGGESRVRAFLIMNGYQIPELQVELPNPIEAGGTFRVDYLWVLADGSIVIGEFDGKAKYQDENYLQGGNTLDAIIQERQRESRLTLLGYPVLRFTFDDLTHPARLRRLLDTAGIPRDENAAAHIRQKWNVLR